MKIQDSFIPAFKRGFIQIKSHFSLLSPKILFRDFLTVAAGIGFVIVPAFLIGSVFILLPQGRDTLLLAVEKLADGYPYPVIFLLISLGCWGIISELGVRYAIYISDNSGKNLSDERVAWRKTLQKLFAAIFLIWPFVITGIALTWCMFSATYAHSGLYLCFGACLFLDYWLMSLISNLYFKKALLGAGSLPQEEQSWLQKLYGIYNDFVYALPEPSVFKGSYQKNLATFTDAFTKNGTGFREHFPQDINVLDPGHRVPASFILLNANEILQPDGELYKWVYEIPTTFYKGLHKQVWFMALIAVLLFLVIAFLPVRWGVLGVIGAPGLICFAFACYTAFYLGLLYLDKALFRNWKVSLRLLLVVLFLGCSYFNHDHPVRHRAVQNPQRPLIAAQFTKWFSAYRNKVDAQLPKDTARIYPVVFICAEGGALRTGAYTSLYLSTLEDTLQHQYNLDFRHCIFAMSGVSGGSVGLGFYNAIAYRSRISGHGERETKIFFAYDALSPLAGKMFFGDFLNLFLPCDYLHFDRAVALEQAWEAAYEQSIKGTDMFRQGFITDSLATDQPLLVINTTEIETGLQCWISNMRPDSILFQDQRDLLQAKVRQVNYSTAINFSSRFPLFSPAGEIDAGKGRFHYLDGGYAENTGAGSMLEILRLLKLKAEPAFSKVRPIVICLRFSNNTDSTQNIRFINEVAEIGYGLYDTRSGRTETAMGQLSQFVKQQHHGIPIVQELSASQKEVPMNWALSGQSISNLEGAVNAQISDKGKNAILLQMLPAELPYLKTGNK
jgi:hypothetical protein